MVYIIYVICKPSAKFLYDNFKGFATNIIAHTPFCSWPSIPHPI